jgi:membrane-associated phospholipid phosphatase
MTSVLPRTVAPAPRAEPVRPSPHPGRAGLLTALPGCAVAFALAYWAFVRTAAGQQIENAVVLDAQAGRASAPDLFAGALASMDVGPCVCAGVLTVLAIGFARQRFAAGGAAAGLVVGSLLVARLLKLTLLTRADLDPGSAVARHNSFPSGHVSAAVAVLLALAIVLPRGARPWVMIPGAVGVGWVAYATVLLGWHRPSDAARSPC